MGKILDQLKSVDLREHWSDEAREFTPWLAREENLKLLSEAVGIDIELVGTEKSVGSFKVDILAKDADTERNIVIENQLEKTNHNHLGQLLTYASGHDAAAVIWIARNICEEHRKALDWLNEMTKDEVSFFGLEIELWKIGQSNPAPKFNLVSQPNNWARTLSPSDNSPRDYTETKLLQQEVWKNLIDFMKKRNTFLSLRKARPQHWYSISIGRSHFKISLTLNSKLKRVGCELYISPPESKPAFNLLFEEKNKIEEELGAKLEWQELPHRGASRVIQYHNLAFDEKENWPELFEWFQERSESFHKVFSKE